MHKAMKERKREMMQESLELGISSSQKSRMKKKLHRKTKKIWRLSLPSIKLKVKMVMGRNPKMRLNWGEFIRKLKMVESYLYKRKKLSAKNQTLVMMGMGMVTVRHLLVPLK